MVSVRFSEVCRPYRRLARHDESRLGWRILLHLDDPGDRIGIIRRALRDGEEIADMLPVDYRDHHLELAGIVAHVRAGDAIDDGDRRVLEDALKRSMEEVARSLGVAEDEVEEPAEVGGVPTVTVTTLEGAKGLQAAHVFVVGMNDGHFPRDNEAPDEHEACCMLVALTRATKRCHLVSCRRFGREKLEPSVFIRWLGDLVQYQRIDAAYFGRRG